MAEEFQHLGHTTLEGLPEAINVPCDGCRTAVEVPIWKHVREAYERGRLGAGQFSGDLPRFDNRRKREDPVVMDSEGHCVTAHGRWNATYAG